MYLLNVLIAYWYKKMNETRKSEQSPRLDYGDDKFNTVYGTKAEIPIHCTCNNSFGV